jgi:tRNA 2-thiouridine synthesizing protein A
VAGKTRQDEEPLDLRALKCPLPALLARRALERALPDTTVEVVADDPMARVDIAHMCRQEGYELVWMRQEGCAVRIRLRKPA